MWKVKQKKEYTIYSVDFETFAPTTSYFQRENDTSTYAISAVRVLVKFNWETHRYEPTTLNSNNRHIKLMKQFVTIEQYIKSHLTYHCGRHQIHYFHNGTKFDFRFIEKWLEYQSNWEMVLLPTDEWFQMIKDKKEVCEHTFYTFTNSGIKYQNITIYHPFYRNNKKYWIQIEFRDTIKLWPNTSVLKLSKALFKIDNIDIPKTELDVNWQQELPKDLDFKNLDERVKLRVDNDSLIVAKWLEKRLSDSITFTPGSRIPNSASSLAVYHLMNYLRYESEEEMTAKERSDLFFSLIGVTDKDDVFEVNKLYLDKKWYLGGVTSCNMELSGKVISNVYSYDINSMYPNAMTKFLPYGTPEIYANFESLPYDLETKFIFVLVRFNSIRQKQINCVPFINIRWYNNFHSKSKYIHYVYEMGSYENEILMSLDEFKVFTNPQWFYTNYEIREIHVYSKKLILKDYIIESYKLKQNAQDDVTKSVAKLRMNSLYGKFGEKMLREQQVSREKITGWKDLDYQKDFAIPAKEMYADLGYVFKDEEWDEAKTEYVTLFYTSMSTTSYLPIACAITSLARAHLMSTALNHCATKDAKVYYVDTDSIKTDKPLDDELIDNDELGLWKLEGHVTFFKFLKPKTYCGSNDGVNLDWLASGGVNQAKVKEQLTFSTFAKEVTIKNVLTPHKTKSGVVLIERDKKLMNDVNDSKSQQKEDDRIEQFERTERNIKGPDDLSSQTKNATAKKTKSVSSKKTKSDNKNDKKTIKKGK